MPEPDTTPEPEQPAADIAAPQAGDPQDSVEPMHLFRRQFTRPGAMPGRFAGESHPGSSAVRIIEFDADTYDEHELAPDESITPPKNGRTLWIDVDGVQDHDLIDRIGTALGIDPLAIADVVNVGQRPKLEDHGPYLFLVLRMVVRTGDAPAEGSLDSDQWRWEQFCLFIGDGWVASFGEKPGDCLEGVRARLRQGVPLFRNGNSSMLAAMLIDAVIDNYFPLLENLGERLEVIEDRVVQDPTQEILAAIYRMKRELLVFRRATWPIREVMMTLSRDGHDLLDTATMPYLRDAADHAVQIVEVLESYRELAGSFIDVYLSSVANRTNEVMRVLTIIATIFIPLTFVAGIYGMNFDDVPELHWRFGYAYFWIACGIITLVLLAVFRKLGWLTLKRG